MSEKQTTFLVLLFWLIVSVVARGQGTDPLTGKPYRFEITQPGTIFWSDSSLKEAFAGLTETRRVPVWMDRRCDPTLEVTYVSQDPLNECLAKLDESSADFDIAWSPEMIYVGRDGSADRWATINVAHRDMLKKLTRPQRQRCLSEKQWRWPRLTNPQDLLSELETEWGSPFSGRERVQHDLWPAAKYSRLPFFVRLELLVSGFSLTYDFDEKGNPRIRDMPEAPRVTRSIKSSEQLREKVDAVLEKHPRATLSPDRTKLTASWATHAQMRRETEKPKPPKTVPRHRLEYTLHARDQKLGPFLEQLSKQLQMTCEFSPGAKEQYDKMVSFEVERASLRKLIDAILSDTNLQFTIKGDQLKIRSAKE